LTKLVGSAPEFKSVLIFGLSKHSPLSTAELRNIVDNDLSKDKNVSKISVSGCLITFFITHTSISHQQFKRFLINLIFLLSHAILSAELSGV
jgi:hypothetical protein